MCPMEKAPKQQECSNATLDPTSLMEMIKYIGV